jgi:transposase
MLAGHSLVKTSKLVGCSVKAVRRWWNRYQETETEDEAFKCKKGPGRPCALQGDAASRALQLLTSNDVDGAGHVAKTLLAEGVTSKLVHKSTVIRNARKAANLQHGKKLLAVKGKPMKAISQKNTVKRLKFARANKRRSWGLVLFSDRKKFHFRYPGTKFKKVRWVIGDSAANQERVHQPSKPQCVNIYAGISKFGMTVVHMVAGTSKHKSNHKNKKGVPAKNITASEYVEVMQKTLLPEGQRLFTAQGISTWYFQQDNDPSHSSAKDIIQQWNASKGSSVQLLPGWPPNSPDLNIIENVWAWVQAEVDKMGCKTFDEFKAAVALKVAEVPKAMISNLYRSLDKRMSKVCQNEGGATKY